MDAKQQRIVKKLAVAAYRAEVAEILYRRVEGQDNEALGDATDAAYAALAEVVGGWDEAVHYAKWAMMDRIVKIGGVRLIRRDADAHAGNIVAEDLARI